jgi:hypothetical protein
MANSRADTPIETLVGIHLVSVGRMKPLKNDSSSTGAKMAVTTKRGPKLAGERRGRMPSTVPFSEMLVGVARECSAAAMPMAGKQVP